MISTPRDYNDHECRIALCYDTLGEDYTVFETDQMNAGFSTGILYSKRRSGNGEI